MWIDENVVIDFKLPKDIQGITDLCEETDKNEDYAYDNWADLLDILCKEVVVQGHMTKKQWDTVIRRYNVRMQQLIRVTSLPVKKNRKLNWTKGKNVVYCNYRK